MVHTSINIFDLIVFAILGLSALMSFFRGFVREVLSLGAWVGASIITLYAFPHVAAMLKPHVGDSTVVAGGIAGMLTFMGSLIVISIFSSLLLKFLKPGNDIGVLDNAMGLMFGLVRGALIVAVGYYIFSLSTDEKNYPDWIRGAVSLPYVKEVSAWVAKIAPDYLDDITPGKTDSVDDAIDNAVDNAEEKQEELKDKADDANWPSMDDLKDRMNSVRGSD